MVVASYRYIKVLHSQGVIFCKKQKALVGCCCPPYLIVCLYVISVKGFSDMGKRVRLQAWRKREVVWYQREESSAFFEFQGFTGFVAAVGVLSLSWESFCHILSLCQWATRMSATKIPQNWKHKTPCSQLHHSFSSHLFSTSLSEAAMHRNPQNWIKPLEKRTLLPRISFLFSLNEYQLPLLFQVLVSSSLTSIIRFLFSSKDD